MNKLINKKILLPNNLIKSYINDTFKQTIYESSIILNKNLAYKKNNYNQRTNPLIWELGHIISFYDVHLLKYISNNNYQLLKNEQNKLYNSYKTNLNKRFINTLYEPDILVDKYYDLNIFLNEWLNSNKLNNKYTYLFMLSILHNHMHIESFMFTKKSLLHTNNDFNIDKFDIDNKSKLKFIKIEGGYFEQGSFEGQYLLSFDNEKPSFKTKIKSFYISETPVTNKIYLQFINKKGYFNYKYWCEEGWEFIKTNNIYKPLYWNNNLNLNEPVCHISWYEAKAVAKWLGGRLPTESEWEYVATNNGTTKYPWGDKINELNCNVDYNKICDVDYFKNGDTQHGVKQMIGNIWEWCDDVIYPYDGFCIDPIYREMSYPFFGFKKNLRGGSVNVPHYLIHPKYRNAQLPETRIQYTGVRVVKDYL